LAWTVTAGLANGDPTGCGHQEARNHFQLSIVNCQMELQGFSGCIGLFRSGLFIKFSEFNLSTVVIIVQSNSFDSYRNIKFSSKSKN